MDNPSLLVRKFLDGTTSPEERKVLEQWVLESDDNRAFFINSVRESHTNINLDFDSDRAYQRFLEAIRPKKQKTKILQIYQYAAILVVLLSIGFLTKKAFVDTSVNTPAPIVVDGRGNSPGENKIILRLPDGSTKWISAQGNETVMDAKGNVIANKEDRALTFGSNNSPSLENFFNDVYIPYGQTFKLKLSDGTLVWLNAGSRLRFPQSFADASSTRTVYLEGEAFFDVTKNEGKPFIVNAHEVNIKVLGTKFNISSYGADKAITTTLVEGAVSVYEARTPENALRLIPSFQATYNKSGNSFRKARVDTDIYTAWMENKLVIDNLTFPEILKKMERMHNVTFINKAKHLDKETYKGEFGNEGIESILKTISLSTPFTYEIDHNTITITE